MSQIMPKKTRNRKVKIPEAIEILSQEEAAKLVDMENVAREAVTSHRAVRHHLYR